MPSARAIRSYAHKALGAGRYPLLSLLLKFCLKKNLVGNGEQLK